MLDALIVLSFDQLRNKDQTLTKFTLKKAIDVSHN